MDKQTQDLKDTVMANRRKLNQTLKKLEEVTKNTSPAIQEAVTAVINTDADFVTSFNDFFEKILTDPKTE